MWRLTCIFGVIYPIVVIVSLLRLLNEGLVDALAVDAEVIVGFREGRVPPPNGLIVNHNVGGMRDIVLLTRRRQETWKDERR